MKAIHYAIALFFLFTGCQSPTLFESIPASHSGIDFNNRIVENDSINPLDMVNIYNGGGVGVGDFNNDGWADVYFVGNRVANRLYLNKGGQGKTDFQFEDVTDRAGVGGAGRWGRGVAVVDINQDGWDDLYVCNTLLADSLQRRNLLYVNQKLSKDGVPVFREMAAQYGLDIHVQSTMANFFDYDNDGDLDMYLTVNEASSERNPNQFGNVKAIGPRSTGRLFENDWSASAKHPVYRDVSATAGMQHDGFGHSATVVDINLDGWKDISVANDFLSSNLLYINNGDKTFTNRASEYFKHTSLNAMGQDIADINNDGLADLIELDMNPEDNYRKKMMMGPNNYNVDYNFGLHGYQHQYVRNTLQLNQGPRVGPLDSIGSPAFSEVGFLSGVAQTDWSWTPLLADFTNDGYRDLIVTNGYPKDVTDRDFIAFRDQPFGTVSKQTLLGQIPVVKIHNYAYENKGDLRFADVTTNWGLDKPTFSNGAAYADFNNDGAMDMVINNINDEALLYKNTIRAETKTDAHYLQITFAGEGRNRAGIGAFATIYYDRGKQQTYENTPYRGYLSTHQAIAHFGLGSVTQVDSVVIIWPGGKKQVIQKVSTDKVLRVSANDANLPYKWAKPMRATNALFRDVTDSVGIRYRHSEFDFIDFNVQQLLPHKLSEYSPALAVGDVNGDELDDFIIGGNAHDPAQLFLQQATGKFRQQNVFPPQNLMGDYKDEGLLLFDADGNNTLDLYVTRGGYKQPLNDPAYQDKLYLNDGKGNFAEAVGALPNNHTSKLCVRAADFNKDGKLDLFVSGRVDPGHYPTPVSSFIFRNDSQNGQVKFTDVTRQIAPALNQIGMVCDALFTDIDNDTWPDLILTGEWMPITVLKNNRGTYATITDTGLDKQRGWWSSIVAGDFRHTGRMDYIVGNMGLNTYYQADEQRPVTIMAADFEKNGTFQTITALFLPDQKGKRQAFPAHGRDDLARQMPSLKKKFTNYKLLAGATVADVLSPEQQTEALKLTVNTTESCFLRNDGNGKFTLIPLPKQAQLSTLNGMVADDFDGDGNLDVALSGNDFGTEVSIGRYDALNGLVLKGDGQGNFQPLSMLQSGLYIPGNGKALVKLHNNRGGYYLAASQNNGPLKLFRQNKDVMCLPLKPGDVSAIIRHKNGKLTKHEFPVGSSFLSQSGQFVRIDKTVASIVVTDQSGKSRSVR